MTPQIKERILQREEYAALKHIEHSMNWSGHKVLITGAKGSIGQRLIQRLDSVGAYLYATDKDEMDVTNSKSVMDIIARWQPTIIINLAGAKHAPEGEVNCHETLSINTNGVINLIEAVEKFGIKTQIVQASTCKSCNPETLYGATKLISERMVMNYGGSVARFFNVIETSGNVFEIWQEQNPISVSIGCTRHYITLDEAVGLTIFACFNKGRFIVNAEHTLSTEHLAEIVCPDKQKKYTVPRRGDRLNEPFSSTSEQVAGYFCNDSVIKIVSSHD